MKSFTSAQWLGLVFSVLTCSAGLTAFAYTNFVLTDEYKDDKSELYKRLERIENKLDRMISRGR